MDVIYRYRAKYTETYRNKWRHRGDQREISEGHMTIQSEIALHINQSIKTFRLRFYVAVLDAFGRWLEIIQQNPDEDNAFIKR